MADYNVPLGAQATLSAVLANGNDAGNQSITSGNGAKTIWNGDSVPNASVEGLVHMGANSLSGYPLVLGTDLPAAGVDHYLAATDPAAKLSSYPLSLGKDIPAAGVANYLAATDPAAKLSAYPLVPGTDMTNLTKVVTKDIAKELTGITATTVLTFTPAADGVFIVKLALTVKTAATTVTLSASWTDPTSATAETYTWENAESIAVGTRLELPIMFVAAANDAISISATAGTANQVYVSGSIEQLV